MPSLLDPLTPQQRYRRSSGLFAGQFNRQTPQDSDVVERGSILPFATYANGMTGLAWPSLVTDAAQAFVDPARAARGEMGDYFDNREAFIKSGMNFAGTAAVGGSVVPHPQGALVSNSVRAGERSPITAYRGTHGPDSPKQNLWNRLFGWGDKPYSAVDEVERMIADGASTADVFRKMGLMPENVPSTSHVMPEPTNTTTSIKAYRGLPEPSDHPDLGTWWGSTDREVANTYALPREIGGAVIEGNAQFRNPLTVDAGGSVWDSIPYNGKQVWSDGIAKAARDNGHDGLILNNVVDTADPVAFNQPSTVVAALRRGTVYDNAGNLLFANSQNSALPGTVIRDAARDLPMDTASRMARAKEMGFDTSVPWYHGTTADINAFSTTSRGDTTLADSARKASFFTSDPVTASEYASLGSGRDVISLEKRQAAAEKAGDLQTVDRIEQQLEAMQLDPNGHFPGKGYAEGANVIPVYPRGRFLGHDFSANPYWDEGAMNAALDAARRGESPELKAARQAYFDAVSAWEADPNPAKGSVTTYPGVNETFDAMVSAAKSKTPYDGVLFKGIKDSPFSPDRVSDVLAVFDPSNVRSVNAAFDPAMSHSANLLAANSQNSALPGTVIRDAAREPQNALTGGIRADHGSPHDFDALQNPIIRYGLLGRR